MNYVYKMLVAVVVVALFLASAAQAIDSPFIIDNIPNIIGGGGGMVPDYLGSDDSSGVAAPFFRWTFNGQERYLQLIATELSFNVLNHPNFVLGPVLNYRPGRNDDVEDIVVKKMEKIDDTVEAGIMAGYIWKDNENPRHRFITSLTYYHDAGDVYKGWLMMGGLRYWYPVSKPVDLQVGGGATCGSSEYMNTYFGVSDADAAKTGLNRFEAGSGFRDVNAQLAMVVHLSMNWHLGAGVKYFNLINDAAESPIVDKRGDTNQLIYGIGAAYSW